MRLQGMAILYIIIIIPMLIVISLTLSAYREQLNNNIKYNTDLTGAVNDAITAFELNSSAQDYSNVSDNFTSLVDASVNIFRRSIATRLNMTNADESLMNRYFPLALFTGYSGYYIYSPTYAPVVVKNPNTGQAAFSSDATPENQLHKDTGTYTPSDTTRSLQYTPVLLKHRNHDNSSSGPVRITTNKSLLNNSFAKEEIDYSLKQMIPYSMHLRKNNHNDILLNFTLDNYISFTGKIDKISFNKSGYLLDHDDSISLKRGNTEIYKLNKITDSLPLHHLSAFDEYVDKYIETELANGNQNITLNVKTNEKGITKNVNIVFMPSVYKRGYKDYIDNGRTQMTGEYAYQLQQLDAIKYYIKAANFSNFVYKNLSIFTEEDIVPIELGDEDREYQKYFLEYDRRNREPIFINSGNRRISDYNSTFNEVKRKAIRNSVQYDLIIATINYNHLVSSSEFILRLPVITENDWERIIENISFTAFLQGLSIGGGKKYSNYAVSTSTMNEFVINPDTIFFTDYTGFNQGDIKTLEGNDLYYHKINCTEFLQSLVEKRVSGNDMSNAVIGFKMSEFIYDARWSREEAKYIYDHKNYSHFNCIINNNLKLENYTTVEEEIINKSVMAAVAAEKERAFKTNKIVGGDGYETKSSGGNVALNSKFNFKSVEVATRDAINRNRTFSVRVQGDKSNILFTVNQSNSVMSLPSEEYTRYRDYMNNLMRAASTWENIHSIIVQVSSPDHLAYMKVRYH